VSGDVHDVSRPVVVLYVHADGAVTGQRDEDCALRMSYVECDAVSVEVWGFGFSVDSGRDRDGKGIEP